MELLSLAIVSAFVSGLTQVLKKYVKLPGDATVIGLSFVFAIVYFLAHDSVLWQDFLVILGIANTIYGLLIQRFE